jgi:hypothetical protein
MFAAIAITIAIHLIESIWAALLMIAVAGFAIGGTVLLLRNRRRDW